MGSSISKEHKRKPASAQEAFAPSQQQFLYSSRLETAVDPSPHAVDEVEVFHVPHLSEWAGDAHARTHPNPVRRSPGAGGGSDGPGTGFVPDAHVVLGDVTRADAGRRQGRAFLRAGVRERIAFGPPDGVRAAVVTCGGLCPGLNNVVFHLAHTLHYRYGVDSVFGVRSGLRGVYDEEACGAWVPLHPRRAPLRGCVREGGTVLGSSRGGFDLGRILDALERRGVNQLYVVGGDGTHRAAQAVYEGARARGTALAVATVPKTVDNDLGTVDASFGFATAVHESVAAVASARVEASCAPNGVGIVQLMGRRAGFIAANATLASAGDVDLCLVPEAPFSMAGVLAYLERVVRERGHAVVVVAEGAGQELVAGLAADGGGGKEEAAAPAPAAAAAATDESGNVLLGDFGCLLQRRVREHFAAAGIGCAVKYHAPSYLIRSVPAIPSDAIYTMVLAQNAVHGAMAGYSGFVSATVNSRPVWMPVSLVTETSPARLNPRGRTIGRVLATTGQPAEL